MRVIRGRWRSRDRCRASPAAVACCCDRWVLVLPVSSWYVLGRYRSLFRVWTPRSTLVAAYSRFEPVSQWDLASWGARLRDLRTSGTVSVTHDTLNWRCKTIGLGIGARTNRRERGKRRRRRILYAAEVQLYECTSAAVDASGPDVSPTVSCSWSQEKYDTAHEHKLCPLSCIVFTFYILGMPISKMKILFGQDVVTGPRTRPACPVVRSSNTQSDARPTASPPDTGCTPSL